MKNLTEQHRHIIADKIEADSHFGIEHYCFSSIKAINTLIGIALANEELNLNNENVSMSLHNATQLVGTFCKIGEAISTEKLSISHKAA